MLLYFSLFRRNPCYFNTRSYYKHLLITNVSLFVNFSTCIARFKHYISFLQFFSHCSFLSEYLLRSMNNFNKYVQLLICKSSRQNLSARKRQNKIVIVKALTLFVFYLEK